MPSNPEYFGPGQEDDERVEVSEVNANALAILNQSEHAAMVQTANLQGNKRKLDEFDAKLLRYANHSQPVALSMFYSLPRAGKQIVGASIRFAEVVVPCWKNCAAAVRMVGDSRETVTAQGIFIDYEANIRVSIEASRRITDKNGNRYNSDMIVTTGNAASSIAYRNAVLRGVPRALWTPAYEEAKLTAVGKAKSHNERVAAAMEYLTKLGVNEWQIMNSIGCASDKEIEVEHLLTLKVLCEEIKRGDKTIEEVFGSPFDKEIESLMTQMGKNETAKRLLRSSYMGRAKDLVEYLRDQVNAGSRPAQSSAPQEKAENKAEPATQEQTKETPAAAQEQQGDPHARRGRGRPRKDQGGAQEAEPQSDNAPETEPAPAAQADESGKFNF